MNKERRAKISIAMAEIGRLRSKLDKFTVDLTEFENDTDKVKSYIETIQEDEEEARDNIPESLQDSENYWKSDAACDYLNCATDVLDELMEVIENLNKYFMESIGYLENAKG